MEELMRKICLTIRDNPEKHTTFKDFGVDKETFGTAIELCLKEGLIKDGLALRNGRENKIHMCGINEAKLTEKGYDYI